MCDAFDQLLHCHGQGGEFEATGLQPADKGNHGADSPAEADADAAHQEEEDEEMVELAAGAEPQSIPKRSATSAEPQLQRLFKHFAHVIHSFADILLQRDVSLYSTCLWPIHDMPRN